MASTYTTRIKAEQQEEFSNYDAWGPFLNAALQKLDGGIAGIASYTLSATKTLTSNNGTDDEASKPVQLITGGSGATINLPAVQRWYFFKNDSTGNAVVQVTGGGGASVTIPTTRHAIVICDGTDCTFLRPDRPWRKISTTTTSSGTTHDIAVPRTFESQFMLVFNDVRQGSGAGTAVTLDFYRSTAASGGARNASLNITSGVGTFGAVVIDDQLVGSAYIGSATAALYEGLSHTGTTSFETSGTYALRALYWGGANIRVAWASGTTFTNGTIELWGR